MPMKTIGASMSGNSSVWSRISAAIPNTASAIVTTTVMIGRRMAKSEMNMIPYSTIDRWGRWGVGGAWSVTADATPTPSSFTPTHDSQHLLQHSDEPRHVRFIVVQVRRHADRVAAYAHEHPRLGETLRETAGQTARQLHADDVRDAPGVWRHRAAQGDRLRGDVRRE